MVRPIRVIPAILADDPEKLKQLVRQAETFTSYVQFDIMDGKFVPSRSIGANDIDLLKPKLDWEVHLMVLKPENYLSEFRKAGAKRIIFHYEATSEPKEVISAMRRLNLGVGLALNPETPVSAILPLVNEIDVVLFMTVHPGFYGAKFLPEVMEKIRELRRILPKMEIEVDGGIKQNNISGVAQAGVDKICVGSAVFLQPNPAESYRRLVALARGDTT